jgi:formylglycine-generating enzyme required for sulfatase activity
VKRNAIACALWLVLAQALVGGAWAQDTALSGSPFAPPASARAPGETSQDCDEYPKMVVVPAGRFRMGSTDDEPGHKKAERTAHEVVIFRAFAVGKYEVTRGPFAQFVRESGYAAGSGWQNHPQRMSDPVPPVLAVHHSRLKQALALDLAHIQAEIGEGRRG